MSSEQKEFTVGDLARRWGISEWKIRRIFVSGALPEPERVGRYRAIPASAVPDLIAVLKERGHLPEEFADAF